MAKIILSKGDTVLREIALCKERITIGRRPHNDIVIEDLAISGEHAAVVTVNGDFFLEDLNSTNGTQVNGQPVRTHFLQEGDVIELAQFRMRYVADSVADSAAKPDVGRDQDADATFGQNSPAIRFLNGPNAGKEMLLNKSLITIGRAGIQVAVLTRSENAYFLAHVEGMPPLVNGQPLGERSTKLSNGDVIELSGTRMELRLS